MATISSPFPLKLQANLSLQPNFRVSSVLNSTNEIVSSTDGEGISIHRIEPSRVVSAYNTGMDVKFLCAPVCIRLRSDSTVTWTVYEDKGTVILLRWMQNGVGSEDHTIHLPMGSTSIKSLHAVDETGDTIVVHHSNTRFDCYQTMGREPLWTWHVPKQPEYLQFFAASQSPLAEKHNGSICLTVLEGLVQFFPILPVTKPSEALRSFQLTKTTGTSHYAFHIQSGTLLQLCKKHLSITRLNHAVTTYRLAENYDKICSLSTSHILLTSSNTIAVYDIIYGTIQSEVGLRNSLCAVLPALGAYNFYAIYKSENQMLATTISIPETAILRDAIGKERNVEAEIKEPSILLAPKTKVKAKDAKTRVKQLFDSLQAAADSNDPNSFDQLFKDFRRQLGVKPGVNSMKKTKLTPPFVKKILSLIFVQSPEGLSIRIYPDDTIKFLLDADLFSRDLLPSGASGLVSAALGHEKLARRLLEKEPTPFTYRDCLFLVKYALDNPDSTAIVPASTILEAFERAAITLFDRDDMTTVLSADHLQRLLDLITKDTETVLYPNLLCGVLDSIGLGSLILTQSFSPELIDSLRNNLEAESRTLSSCLETSSLLSLIIHRQNDVPTSNSKDRAILYKDQIPRLGKVGWIEVVAEEGGMSKRRRMWMKKPPLPGSGKELTHRFVATAKFQETGPYSLDRMILD